jgi:holliday junction DNA helicase RuvA
MIARLRGRLAHKAANRVIIDTGGVGYEATIPVSTFYELGEVGDEVELQIFTYVREDALSLFGFLTAREKQIFTQLIQISGIGPRLAVTILSGLPVDELLQAVSLRDVARLATIPGVGKKTAERIALEMRDRIRDLAPEIADLPCTGGDLGRDVVSALVNLGYVRAKAETLVARLLKEDGNDRFDLVLRKALRELSS